MSPINNSDSESSIKNKYIEELGLLEVKKDDRYFYDVVTLAAFATNCSISYLAFLDNENQYLKSAFGSFIGNVDDIQKGYFYICSKEDSLCHRVIVNNKNEPTIISDLSVIPEYKDNKFVAGKPNIKFYCGMPIRFKGCVLGTLCCCDPTPKELTPTQISSIYILRGQIESIINCRYLKNKKKWYSFFK